MNHEFQQQQRQGGPSLLSSFQQTQSTESGAAELAHARLVQSRRHRRLRFACPLLFVSRAIMKCRFNQLLQYPLSWRLAQQLWRRVEEGVKMANRTLGMFPFSPTSLRFNSSARFAGHRRGITNTRNRG